MTETISAKLKSELFNRIIFSKFSVIGLGNHDSALLGMMADIGTERGLYTYVKSEEFNTPLGEQKVNLHFDKSYEEIHVAPGLVVNLPGGKQIFCPVSKFDQDTVVIEGETIMTAPNIE